MKTARTGLFAAWLLLLAGCASQPISRETTLRLHEELLERKCVLVVAHQIDAVTAVTNATTCTLRLTFTGDSGPTIELSTATPIAPDGFLLTARHSIRSALAKAVVKPWVIEINGGKPRLHPAQVVWASTNCDLALLKISAATPHVFEWSHPHEKLLRGATVWQGGLRSHMASGTIRETVALDKQGEPFVLVRATVKARGGDSGGPLMDSEGRLIGIMTDRIVVDVGWRRLLVGGSRAVRPNIDRINGLIENYRRTATK